MIIWGSKGKSRVINDGHFYCPRCRKQRHFEHKILDKYFTLYFIPIFRTKTVAEYVECSFCNTPYETSILERNQKERAELDRFINLVQEAINAGTPLNAIYQSLQSNGATEEQANTILSIATNGKLNQCPQCKLAFSGSLNYCSNCGSALKSLS